MKIGINSRIFQQKSTGIPYYIQSLYQRMIKQNKNDDFVFFQTSKNKTIGKTLTVSMKSTGLSGALFDLFFVNRLIKKEKIDLYHGACNILPYRKIKGVKYVVTIHDLAFMLWPPIKKNFYYYFSKYGIKRSLQNADFVVCDSENTKKDVLENFNINKNKIKTVYLGVNPVFNTNKKTKPIVKGKYFLSITSHPKRKNILSVLEVFAKNPQLKNHRYVIAGGIGNAQMKVLKSKIKSLDLEGRVKIMGYVSETELLSLYQHANFFIFPSFYEGFGLPVIEAMSCRCPVITSNNSSLTEIMPTKEWLIDPYSIENISLKISKMISMSSEEREKMIRKNYDYSRKFSWSNAAKKMGKIYEDLNENK